MNKILFTLLFAVAISVSQAQTTWNIDKAHSGIRFSVTHMVISEVEGNFTDFDAKVVSATEDFTGAEVEFSAKTASVNTGNERRDNHLRNEDFFNVEVHPEIKFSGMIKKEGEKYKVVGDLTMMGISKEATFNLKYNGQIDGRRGKKAGFKLTGSINRFDYGLTWDRALETGGLVVGKEVEIVCNVEMNEAAPQGGN